MGCGTSKIEPSSNGGETTTKRTTGTIKEKQQKQASSSDSNDTQGSDISTTNNNNVNNGVGVNGGAGTNQAVVAAAAASDQQQAAQANPGAPQHSDAELFNGPIAGSNNNANLNGSGSAVDGTKNAASKQEIKMLLLGSGESGKSTIIKQIKIIHQNGFSEKELRDLRPFVYKNVLDCAIAVVKALREFDMVTQLDELNNDDLECIMNANVPLEASEHLDQDVAQKVIILCKDPIIDKLIQDHRKDFYLMDSAKYFFENLDRICDPSYIPSVTDALRTRKQTSGIFETVFYMGSLRIHMFDVGGQRSERKKWIHCFDNVTLIMFCVALSEYDQVLLEESTQNRLEESLKLFDSVVNSRWFNRTSVVLFLNKIDVFAEKLSSSPLEKFFPDYTGGNDINKAAKYILWRFTQLNRAQLNIYPHVTQAIDTSNIKLVFVAVKETILENSLRDTGIL